MPIDRLKREQGEKTELFLKIRHAGFIRETPLIIHTLKAFSEASIHIREKILCDSHGNPIAGYDLTEPLNAAL
jgi:hypothetical protein